MILNYLFKFEDNNSKEFTINLDDKTLDLLVTPSPSPEEWTKLECCKCSNCPLSSQKHPYCPIALNIKNVINFCKDMFSYEKVFVTVKTEQREYSKKTALQKAVGSLIGIYMVTSGCPIIDKLRPMVKFHLPFATGDETIYRAISMYLTAQFFLQKEGEKPDWQLNNLKKIYADINTVNSCFIKRLHQMQVEDAVLNAIVRLDCFASLLNISLKDDNLNELSQLFRKYLHA